MEFLADNSGKNIKRDGYKQSGHFRIKREKRDYGKNLREKKKQDKRQWIIILGRDFLLDKKRDAA